jgi:SET domain-containing protein
MTGKDLYVKKSRLKGAGKGLFTRKYIPKGTLIIEYKGKVRTWKEVMDGKLFNGYVFYITRNHVVDAIQSVKALARYANDAKGLSRVKGLRNNAVYFVKEKKVYIKASVNIQQGAEILVEYGKEYWDTIRHNNKAKQPVPQN